jgi:capsular polysaccharide biosynthesis protein
MDVQKEQTYDDEIDLFDLFRKLWCRKKMIAGVTLGCTILVFGIYSFFPKVYRVNAIIEPGTRLFFNSEGQIEKESAVVSPTSIREAILGGAFNKEIAEKLTLKKISDIPKISVKIPKDTNLLMISLESKDTGKGLAILNELITKISDDIKMKIELEKRQIENSIKSAEIEYQGFISNINLSKKQIVQIQNKIQRIEDDRKKIMIERPTDAMSVLLYSDQIQDNQIYMNSLQDKVNYYELSAMNSKQKIDNLRQKQQSIMANKIHLNPTVEENPVGPKKLLATAIAFFFSFFTGIVLALILDKVSPITNTGEKK